MDNRPISEQYRLAAPQWSKADAVARMLEEGKTTFLAQKMTELGDIPVSKAERDVKATTEWADYIKRMVNARTVANEAKVEMQYLNMRYFEQSGAEATRRAEMRL